MHFCRNQVYQMIIDLHSQKYKIHVTLLKELIDTAYKRTTKKCLSFTPQSQDSLDKSPQLAQYPVEKRVLILDHQTDQASAEVIVLKRPSQGSMPLTCQQPANRIQTRLVQFPLFTLQSQILAETTNRIVYFGTVEQLTNVGSLKGVIKYLQQHYRVHLQVLGETCSSFLSQRVAFIAPGRREQQSTGNGRSKQSKVHLP